REAIEHPSALVDRHAGTVVVDREHDLTVACFEGHLDVPPGVAGRVVEQGAYEARELRPAAAPASGRYAVGVDRDAVRASRLLEHHLVEVDVGGLLRLALFGPCELEQLGHR